MWWIAIFAGLYFGRSYIAKFAAPFLPDISPISAAFYLHCIVIVGSVVYAIPLELVGFGIVKRPSYLLAMWSTTLSSILTLKGNYGSPPFPENFSISNFKQSFAAFSVKLQPWLQQAMMSVDFHFLFFSLIFLAATPSVWVLLILGRRSLWTVCTTMAKNESKSRLWLMFAPQWDKLKAKNTEVLEYSAMAEVLLGLWLTVALAFPMRQILTCILYWNYLKMRYQMLNMKGKTEHKKAWGQLGARVQPIFDKVPIIEKPFTMAKDWFTRMG